MTKRQKQENAKRLPFKTVRNGKKRYKPLNNNNNFIGQGSRYQAENFHIKLHKLEREF